MTDSRSLGSRGTPGAGVPRCPALPSRGFPCRGRGTREPERVRGANLATEDRSAGAAQARSSGLSALSFKSPPGTGNGGEAGARRCTSLETPVPGPRWSPPSPRPLTREAPAWEGAAGAIAPARRGAPPLAGSAEGLPHAPRPPPPHLGSSLVGAEAGPEALGGPPTRAVHGVPGVSGRLPASRLLTGQHAPGPAP